MSLLWLLAVATFGILVVVGVTIARLLMIEVRATAESLTSIVGAVASVEADLVRVREAIDALDLPSPAVAVGERALAVILRWAVRRVLPL